MLFANTFEVVRISVANILDVVRISVAKTFDAVLKLS
jgi:hypothetical protein